MKEKPYPTVMTGSYEAIHIRKKLIQNLHNSNKHRKGDRLWEKV